MRLVDEIPDYDTETKELMNSIENGELDELNVEEFFDKINRSKLRPRLVKGVFIEDSKIKASDYFKSKRENNVL